MTRYTLDTSMQDDMLPLVKARRGENRMRFVNLALTTDGAPVDLTGTTVTFNGLTAGNTKVIINVTTDDATKGYITVVFPKNAFSAPGWYKEAYISIAKPTADPASITTASFRIKVFDNVDLSAEDAENVITVLDSTLGKLVEDTKKTLDKAIVDMTGQFSATQDNINAMNEQLGGISTTLTNTQNAINNLSLNMIKGTITDTIDSIYNAGWYAVKNASATGIGTGLNGLLVVIGNKTTGGTTAGTFQIYIDNKGVVYVRNNGGKWLSLDNSAPKDISNDTDVNSVWEIGKRQVSELGDSVRWYYLGTKDLPDLPTGFNKQQSRLQVSVFSSDMFFTVYHYNGGVAFTSATPTTFQTWQVTSNTREMTAGTYSELAANLSQNIGTFTTSNVKLSDSPYCVGGVGTIVVQSGFPSANNGTITVYPSGHYAPTFVAHVQNGVILEWNQVDNSVIRPTGTYKIADVILKLIDLKVQNFKLRFDTGTKPSDRPTEATGYGIINVDIMTGRAVLTMHDDGNNYFVGLLPTSGTDIQWKKVTTA